MKANKILKLRPKKNFILVALIFLLLTACLLGVLTFFLEYDGYYRIFPANLNQLAAKIIKQCSESKYRQGCYEKTIPLIMDSPYNLSMQKAFEVTSSIQEKDPQYVYCHVTGHYLSEKEVRKNPDDWKTVITKCPVAGCANGCVHGAIMEKFHAENLDDNQLNKLSKEIGSVCEKNELWQPNRMETTGCFHALGHAAMYLTSADINRSLAFCYAIGNRNTDNYSYYYHCYQGVFMQIFQPLEKEDFQLVQKIKPITREGAVKFCSNYNDLAKIACLNQSWPLFSRQFMIPETLMEYCNYYEPKNRKYCYSTAINILTSNYGMDVQYMYNYCSKLNSPPPSECLGLSASRMVEIDTKNLSKAIQLCEKGTSIDPTNQCFQMLVNTSNSILRNPHVEKEGYCKQLPIIWQERCLKK